MQKTIMSYLPGFYISGLSYTTQQCEGLTVGRFITEKDELIDSVKLSGSIRKMISKVSLQKCLAEAVQFHLSDNGGYENSQLFYDDFKKNHPKVALFFTVKEFVRFLTGLMQVEFLTILMKRSFHGLVIFVKINKTVRPVIVCYSQHKKILSANFLSRKQFFCNILISNPTDQK